MGGEEWRDAAEPFDAETRRSFIEARRASHAERMSTLAPRYDEEWGAISPSHDRFVRRLVELTRPAGTILDAACGTGRFWAMVLAAGRSIVGVDQSPGMLQEASRKHPEVPVGRIGLQELPFDAFFDAVMCVDAMEFVAPEDWPAVLERLREAVRRGGVLYLTVELADEQELRDLYEKARAAGAPVVPGEDFDGVGYHYYPTRESVDGWLDAAGLERLDDADGDYYRHLLVRRAP